MHRAELHVHRSRLHINLSGLACVRFTRYAHASICFRLPTRRTELHVRCPWLHVHLVGLGCVRLERCTRLEPPCWAACATPSLPGTHVRLLGLCTLYTLNARRDSFKCRAQPHVRRPRLHVRLVGLAHVHLAHYTHASTLLIYPAQLHVRCPWAACTIAWLGLCTPYMYTHA
jgi:hypothetical protein